MTLLAGAFVRGSTTPIDSDLVGQLTAAVSRNSADEPIVFRDHRCILVKVDIGAHSAPAHRSDPDGSVSLMAGDPVLDSADEAQPPDRRQSLDRLHAAALRGAWEELEAAQGVFSSVHYDAAEGRLALVTDKLGIRPIYYWVGLETVVFASALRVLEALPFVPKRLDLRALIEARTLGVPLGSRTVFADISLLRAAEVVQIDELGVTQSQYWRWDGIDESRAPESELIEEAYARFGAAMDRRLGTDSPVAAFLSGGLDSRVITAELRRRGLTVHTFNFARAGTQDQLFGNAFARRVGSVHHELPIIARGSNAKYAFTMAEALNASTPSHPDFPVVPRCVWSGDGGSIGVGHVRVDSAVVSLLRREKQTDAVDLFLEQQHARIPRRLFRGAVARQLERATADGVHEELARIQARDPGRSFHLFLMLNDQRRHLADHFENIDLHRLEYHLPFFDSRFLELIVSVPLDRCIGHGFYSRWLACFPAVVREVPWQTYPGHEPCPLPVPPDLGYQWEKGVSTLTAAGVRKRSRLAGGRATLDAADFPDPVLRKGYLSFVYWVYRLGIRDYGYALDYATMIHDHWRRTGGNYVLATAPPDESSA